MFVSYKKENNSYKFMNTYSTFNSAVKGFYKECEAEAKKRNMDTEDLAGEEMFFTNLVFNCECSKRKKKCNSIGELERWLMSKMFTDVKGKNRLLEVDIKAEASPILNDEIRIISATRPTFLCEMETESQFIKDLFGKKENWFIR